jgi:hypothetical protein
MGAVTLHEGADGYLCCPRRGDIDVQWCLGCPRVLRVVYEGERAVVVCDPGSRSAAVPGAGPLRDLPEIGFGL